ncbi:UvrD-helicase domain-containing protein [uncultured Arcticibacterium sp.]|uniref:UvrD-helicase domain-containing protein n=1 Tax=uncultured Arcticibacterium sp. TaxID=2173042 RepID=UPI0030F8FE11
MNQLLTIKAKVHHSQKTAILFRRKAVIHFLYASFMEIFSTNMSLYKIYGSSAGSGKTFTLTKTYLQLVLSSASPHYFKQILAITFTNDAASEMKSRIIETLKELGGPEEGMSSKTKVTLEVLKEDLPDLHPQQLQARAKAAFEQILQDYADFNVKTIDSFVNQLVSSFALDLGLPYNYEVVLDKRPLLLKATERVFDKIGLVGQEHLTDLIEKFALEKADEGKNWQMLLPNLAGFANNLFDDQFYSLIQKNQNLKYSDYLKVKQQINKHIKVTQNTFLLIGRHGLDLLEKNGLSIDDFAYGKNGFASIFIKVANPNSDILNDVWEPGIRIIDAVENDKWYAAKLGTDKKATIDATSAALISWYNRLIAFLKKEKPKYLLLKEVRNHLDNLALLGEVREEFGKLLMENNMAYITDFNRRINKIVAEEPVPYIFEKLGEKYNHILIDEFQDTSDIQYFNLLPLIENALSKNHFNMLVGDPKQSIYRWRGGKVELMIYVLNQNTDALKSNELLSDNQRFSIDYTTAMVQKENLQKNFRSKKEIIAFNNDFFTKMADQSSEEIIKLAFENKTQETHDGTKSGGHVEMSLIENEKGQEPIDEVEWTLAQIDQKIKETLEAGYHYEDMAILCRKKPHAAAIAEHLIANGINVISADSLLLKNSLGISFLISLLMAYQDPKNKAKHADAILLYHRYKELEFPTDIDFRSNELNCWDFLQSQGITIDQKILGAFGIYQLTESFVNKLGMFEDHALLPYLFAFFDIVQNHIKNDGNSLSDFLQAWEQSKDSYAVSVSKQNAITVSTIHKSKGLEYPVVIVPFAGWSTVPINQSTFWADLEQTGYDELNTGTSILKAAPLPYKKTLDLTLVKDQYQRELEFSKLEALNILYVAFTRPVDRLYVLALAPRSSDNSTYHFLKNFVVGNGIEAVDNKYIISEGETNTSKKTEENEHESHILNKIYSRENLGKLKLKSNLDKVFNEQNQRDQGNLIHTLFSEIGMATDLDQAIQKLQFDGLILEIEKAELKVEAEKILQSPDLKHLYSGNILVENERDILVKDADISRPDRVVYQNDKVTIIDYKTGKKQNSHKTQIKHYGELYHQMGYSDVELLLIYLNPLEIVRV